MAMLTRGGDGSPGLVRIEDDDDSGLVSFNSLAARIQPFDSNDVAGSLNFFSYAPNSTTRLRRLPPPGLPERRYVLLDPPGRQLRLSRVPRGLGAAVEDMGWTMDLVVFDPGRARSFAPTAGPTPSSRPPGRRSTATSSATTSAWETASPIVVRFQGARALVADLDDPALGLDKCDIDIADPQAGIVALESVTPGVPSVRPQRGAHGGQRGVHGQHDPLLHHLRRPIGADQPGISFATRPSSASTTWRSGPARGRPPGRSSPVRRPRRAPRSDPLRGARPVEDPTG